MSCISRTGPRLSWKTTFEMEIYVQQIYSFLLWHYVIPDTIYNNSKIGPDAELTPLEEIVPKRNHNVVVRGLCEFHRPKPAPEGNPRRLQPQPSISLHAQPLKTSVPAPTPAQPRRRIAAFLLQQLSSYQLPQSAQG